MNPERIKAWAPIAFLLIFSSIVSAVIGLAEGYEKFFSWFYPKNQKEALSEEEELIYPIVSGYISGNGNKKGDISSELANNDNGIIYVSGAIDLSRGVGENEEYMENCDPYQQEERGEEIYIKVKTGGQAEFTGSNSNDYEIVCGENSLEIYLNSLLSSTVSAGVDIRKFSGAFAVSRSYEGLSEKVSMREIAIPPNEEIILIKRSREIWKEILKNNGERY